MRTLRVRLVKATIKSPIPVLDLVGLAARSVGLTQENAATTDYVVYQIWARAFYDQYPNVEGIRWRGRRQKFAVTWPVGATIEPGTVACYGIAAASGEFHA